MSCYFFFFFQAEDGIRDDLVTGVQTCALPIYLRARVALSVLRAFAPSCLIPSCDHRKSRPCRDDRLLDRPRIMPQRSEERRVGKECRSRRAPYQSKKTYI